MHWDSDCSSGKITKYKYRSFNFFCQIPWALIFIPLIGLCFEIYCCVCDIISCDSPSPHNKAASERGDDISAGADVNFATDRARPSGGSYHGLSQLSRRVKRLSQPPSSWNCHIFTGVAGTQTLLFITVTNRGVVEKVMKCSTKLAKFCINNGRMKGGREGNLFVSLGLTARVTRVQRAQVLQPLCGIIFAWIWEIQLYNASDAFSRCVRLVQEI